MRVLSTDVSGSADVFTENRMPFTVFHSYEGVVIPVHLQAAVQHSHPAAVMARVASRFLGSMSLIMCPEIVRQSLSEIA